MRSGEFCSLFERRGVKRRGVARPQAAHGPSLVDQCRVRRCRAEERREGGLDVGPRQPRVDGPSVEEVEVGVEFERGRILRRAGRGGQGGYACGLGGRMRALRGALRAAQMTSCLQQADEWDGSIRNPV